MAKEFKASDYNISETYVSFITSDKKLKDLYDKCEYYCKKNIALFTDKLVLREGSDYDGVWLETQPMGGEMYAKRNMEVALNNQLIFMENQRKSGRLPGMIKYQEPFLLQVSYDWLQGFCFPDPAFRMYYLTGHDKNYLSLLYNCLADYDNYLWKYRDSDHDGCLESWCTWDTGEDNSNRFLKYGVSDGGFGGEDAPVGKGMMPFESMDVMSYSYAARRILGDISRIFGNGLEEEWRKKAANVQEKIRSYLWVEERHACFDRDCNDELMDVLTHNNLRCMYYGSFTQSMADDFVRYHLLNPEEFWTYVPLPSIAANDPCFQNINFNNWGGQPEGLTYQRAIQALENYGHVAEIRLLGRKWIDLLEKTGKLVQQYDPFDGTPCITRSEGKAPENEAERYNNVKTIDPEGYGPTILAALEYITYLYGVNISMDKATFSGVEDDISSLYTQHMFGHNYSLETSDASMRGVIDGDEIFKCTRGLSIRTDLEGTVEAMWGIGEKPVEFSLYCNGREYAGTIRPNEKLVLVENQLQCATVIPFDYPYSVPDVQ